MLALPREVVKEKLLAYLKEDVGQGDITSNLVIKEDVLAEADVIVKAKGIVAGIEEAQTLLDAMGLLCRPLVKDGDKVEPGITLMHINGKARDILTVERTLLNIVSRMSGIATETRILQDRLLSTGSKVRVASTRKVAPGLLYFDKRAVAIGGGDPHRLHLDDLILIKDNHKILAGGIAEAVRRARRGAFTKKIEAEVTSTDEAAQAIEAGADVVMFDNMTPAEIKATIGQLRGKGLAKGSIFEASGGINATNILEYASSGVDILSLGSLTHSTKALDVSLELKAPRGK